MRKAKTYRVALAGVIGALGLTMLGAGPAQAATPGTIKVCTGKDFFITVKFPGRGGLSITPAKRPYSVTCLDTWVGGNGANERIDVYTGSRYLGSSIYNSARGAEVHGVPGPSFYVV
ncbi:MULTISPECIES: hypothetical protein [Actinokineospora]|uniref:Secreted protein n=1 Tax=Actinokineospora fastidiosa TaxID=1816 RepID=A0A918LK42_9PSEU|nr:MULTISPECIES: hypothetical protein [Actinokineospora]UVS78313.1 hypothetical protein Actkin_02041 [Actinokineospora sp. UTMC 2448]GGS60774.1 hypothetical protein GCM10010171_64590 [Actinokineospora fastidiosa]